jgi:hypothetical protein
VKKWMIEMAAAISEEIEKGNAPELFKNINVNFEYDKKTNLVYAENSDNYKVILVNGYLELLGFCRNCSTEQTGKQFILNGCCNNSDIDYLE